jgi:hypothetical protein
VAGADDDHIELALEISHAGHRFKISTRLSTLIVSL